MREWTEEQIKAIETSPNLLVSAAAGSGKTAVLVERITRKLLPDKNGDYIPADRLLVVTFARDAAREMQERMQKSLNDAFASAENSATKRIIREQLKKLVFADISTIDSFCMRFVKQNFHLLGIDPGFKLFDPSEVKIYTMECINEFFDVLYEQKDERFFLLTSFYSRNYDDREVSELLYTLYSFTRALPDPEFWLQIHADDYASFSENRFCMETELNFSKSAAEAKSDLIQLCEKYKHSAQTTDEEMLKDFGAVDLWSVMNNDISLLDKESFAWNDIFSIAAEFPVLKKSSSKKDDVVIQKAFIDAREVILKPLRNIFATVTDTCEVMDKKYKSEFYPHACALASLTAEFSEFISKKKDKACRYEFNDLEHMTVRLLRDNEDLRKSMNDKYFEILMDEYQDTNSLQEEIFNLLSNGNNRFMVGDMKQSIYRFRNSDPFIFRNKDESYASGNGGGERVVLSKNFRSRPEVLSSINVLFEKIMTYNVGEVEYNEEQALHYGNKSFENRAEGNDYTSEIYVIESCGKSADDDEALSDEETEAAFVADKIRQMIDSKWQVFDGGKFRDACENDFAILMNAVKANSSVYINALKQRGLSSYSEDDLFFEKTEIIMITSFIKTVNNPWRDIPLVSVMRSPVYRFTDSELAQIRLSSFGQLWNCVCETAKTESELGKKCSAFVNNINSWREMSKYMSAHKLIWRIMTDSSLYDMCGVLYGGESALANLKLYMERASVLADSGINTLYDFEMYMDKLRISGGLGSATSDYDGIPIMTIHKSKGLEFPVVFVCGTGKKLLLDGYDGMINIHKDLGFGLFDINPSASSRKSTLNRKHIGLAKNKEGMSEQLRKLYVALTRAKEKLIVTGVVPATSKDRDAFEFTNAAVTEKEIAVAPSFMHCMAPTIKQYGGGHWLYNELCAGTIDTEPENTIAEQKETEDWELYKDEVEKAFGRFELVKQPPVVSTKVSVSELKSRSGVSSKLQKYPDFMCKKDAGGAVFGTYIHEIMENICFNQFMSKEYIASEILRITGEENDAALEKISVFFETQLGKRVLSATEVFREADFETEIPAVDAQGNNVDGETMLLQGVVDLYFYEGNHIVLVDYKTDVCSDVSELADKYSVQLKWYKYAMEKLLKKSVDEVYIYSFYKNTFIALSDEGGI